MPYLKFLTYKTGIAPSVIGQFNMKALTGT